MKKLLFTILFSMAMIVMTGQAVDRDMVVLEIGTGCWCYYCPGAAMGADDLVANGHDVAVIEYHNNSGGYDPFANTASAARNSYYSISGYPTAHFDGVLESPGGSHTVSKYADYLPLYNQRIVIPSDLTIEVYGENSGLTYNITLLIENVNNNTSTNLVAHLALTESEIVYAWQGMTHVNFAERLMAPDHLGTDVDFTSGTVQQIDLQFTIDASWVTTYCELVVFVQDDVTKEIMQGTKVMLGDLEAFQATALFACSDTLPCVTTQVNFTDNSMGQVISWDWTFEGGTPPTSTIQNPTVTYNSLGTYDVQLIVSDGDVIDTLLQENMVQVITLPDQPNTPAGPAEPCDGEAGLEYTTVAVAHATSYDWEVLPAGAGTITGNSTVATLDLNPGFLGAYTVKARANNNCGQSTWSQELQAESHMVPAQYFLSEGAGYCEGEPGVQVTLDGSETGVDYELYLDNVASGQILPGTGGLLDFGIQSTTGIYTCYGLTPYCSNIMVGNSYIYLMNPPSQAATPSGPESVCSDGDDSEYITDGATQATTYVWTISPAGAGVITGTGTEAMVDWDETFSGAVLIAVKGINDCGEGTFSEDLEVTSYAPPSPEITGATQVCNNQSGTLYATGENTGSSYNWDITGGTITSGHGTYEIIVTWGAPGTGTLIVTEVNEHGCEAATEAYEVTIDDCTGLDELAKGGFKIYPNPVSQMAHMEFTLETSGRISIMVFNDLGQPVYHTSEHYFAGTHTCAFNTSALPGGIYTVKLINQKGLTSTSRFTKD